VRFGRIDLLFDVLDRLFGVLNGLVVRLTLVANRRNLFVELGLGVEGLLDGGLVIIDLLRPPLSAAVEVRDLLAGTLEVLCEAFDPIPGLDGFDLGLPESIDGRALVALGSLEGFLGVDSFLAQGLRLFLGGLDAPPEPVDVLLVVGEVRFNVVDAFSKFDTPLRGGLALVSGPLQVLLSLSERRLGLVDGGLVGGPIDGFKLGPGVFDGGLLLVAGRPQLGPLLARPV